jgi:hypothetical protein
MLVVKVLPFGIPTKTPLPKARKANRGTVSFNSLQVLAFVDVNVRPVLAAVLPVLATYRPLPYARAVQFPARTWWAVIVGVYA